MEQEEPVSMGIQTHGPNTLLGQCGIGAPCHLTEGLENPVVLLEEKPGHNLDGKGCFLSFCFFLCVLFHHLIKKKSQNYDTLIN